MGWQEGMNTQKSHIDIRFERKFVTLKLNITIIFSDIRSKCRSKILS